MSDEKCYMAARPFAGGDLDEYETCCGTPERDTEHFEENDAVAHALELGWTKFGILRKPSF